MIFLSIHHAFLCLLITYGLGTSSSSNDLRVFMRSIIILVTIVNSLRANQFFNDTKHLSLIQKQTCEFPKRKKPTTTTLKVRSDHRSEFSNLCNWKLEAWKKFRLQRDSNPWPQRYRCDALPTELWSHTLGARSIVGSHFPVGGVKRCKVYEIIHIWTADIDESEKSVIIAMITSISAVHIWIISYTLHRFTPPTGKWEPTIDRAPNVWLHSSVGRASHR